MFTNRNLHKTLMDKMKALGLNFSDEGVCYGLSEMAKLAAILGKVELIKLHRRLIRVIYEENLKEKIDEAKLVSGFLLNPETLQSFTQNAGLNKHKILDLLKARTMSIGEQEKIINALRHAGVWTSKNIDKPEVDKLLASCRETIEIEIFLLGIAFNQDPLLYTGNYSDLFEEDHKPTIQETDYVIDLLSPDHIIKLCDFTSIYANDQLTDFFQSLREKIDHPTHIPFMLQLHSVDHVITIAYDYDNHSWLFLDPPEIPFKTISMDAILAQKVYRAFSGGSTAALKAQIYVTKANAASAQPLIESWLCSPTMEILRSVTPTKAFEQDNEHGTWLEIAAQSGELPTVKALVKMGAPARLSGKSNNTPYSLAFFTGHREVVEYLAEAHEAFLPPGGAPESLLISAAENGFLELVKLCLSQRMNINYQKPSGWSAICYAAYYKNSDITKTLILAGAEIEHVIQNTNGTTLLNAAIELGRTDIVHKILTAKSLDLKLTTTQSGLTPLCLAAKTVHVAVADLLLYYGADVNHCARNGMTPLMFATEAGNPTMIQYLLHHGADPTRKHQKSDESALTIAVRSGSFENTKLLLMHSPASGFKHLEQLAAESIECGYGEIAELLSHAPNYNRIHQ